MKAKHTKLIYLIFLFLPFLISCGRDNLKNTGSAPEIITTESTNIALRSHEAFNRTSAKSVAKPKTEIRLACMNEQSQIRKAVARFNAENPEYIITVTDYWSYDAQEATDKLNVLYNDILAGKGPDIIEIDNEYIDYSLLAGKGVFEDLTPYLKQSDTVRAGQLVSPVYDALLKNEKLYFLPTNFVLSTMITKKRWAEEHSSWTIEQITKLLKANPDLAESLAVSKEGILRYCIDYCLDLTDGQNTHLNTGLIKKYLELASLAPASYVYAGEYSPKYEGKVLFEVCHFMEVKDYLFTKSVWGEDAALVGYPEAAGNGVVIIPINNLGINSKSTNKDTAWRFIESYFTDDWQKDIAPNWNFSILKTTFEKQLADAMRYDTYLDENGNTKEWPALSYLSDDGTDVIDVYAAREADIQEIRQMLEEARTIKLNKNSLSNIITEEAAYYFAGQKDLEEVIKIIENRVNLLLNE